MLQTSNEMLKGSASVAKKLMNSGFNVNSLRTNDLLRKNEWERLDSALVRVARENLVGVGDLKAKDLTFNVDNPLGVTRVEWETVSDFTPAEINMSGRTKTSKDRAEFTLVGTPLPIISKDFSIDVRTLEASRRSGQALDTTQVELATRKVAESMESMLFNGVADIVMQGSNIKGYKTAPNRNVGTLTGDWALIATTGEAIIGDILSMIDALQQDNYDGPYMLYVPLAFYNKLLNDFKANSDKSILTRIKEIPMIEDVKISRNLPSGASGQVILAQMTSDVVDIIDGMAPTLVQWESEGGFVNNFKVMGIMAPRMKSDANLQSGIAHYSV